jgi:hypothetical protein
MQVTAISLIVTGIKKRRRKPDRHVFLIAEQSGVVDVSFAIAEAKKRIIKEMNTATGARLQFLPMTITTENGFTTRSFGLCDATYVEVPIG